METVGYRVHGTGKKRTRSKSSMGRVDTYEETMALERAQRGGTMGQRGGGVVQTATSRISFTYIVGQQARHLPAAKDDRCQISMPNKSGLQTPTRRSPRERAFEPGKAEAPWISLATDGPLPPPSPNVTSAKSPSLAPTTTASCVSQPSGGRYETERGGLLPPRPRAAPHNTHPLWRTNSRHPQPRCLIFAQWGTQPAGPTSQQVYTWEAFEHGSPQLQRNA